MNLNHIASKEHDKIAQRLISILQKFNNGERFTALELAGEFNVDIRTIQRDLNERLSILPIEKENNYYKLAPYALGQLSFNDIQNFAIISGIKSLYPTFSKQFITDILNDKINKAYLVKNQGHENLQGKSELFEELSAAILNNKQISFVYSEKQRIANPYKLINHNGIWYLGAEENGKLKTYSLAKIGKLEVSKSSFNINEALLSEIEDGKINWISNNTIDVILAVDIKAKEYFLRKATLANQAILEENENCLVVQTQIAFEDEILNLVKYWIPYIKIKSPLYLKEKLNTTLKEYIASN